MNLPDLYARVVAKRPDLAVSNSSYRDLPRFHLTDDIPDLILAKWVKALPEGHDLSRNDGWEVCPLDMGGDPMRTKTHPSPIEALAAFYLDTTDHAAEGAK